MITDQVEEYDRRKQELILRIARKGRITFVIRVEYDGITEEVSISRDEVKRHESIGGVMGAIMNDCLYDVMSRIVEAKMPPPWRANKADGA